MFTPFLGLSSVSAFEDLERLDGEAYGRLFRYLLREGIYIPPSPYEAWFVSAAHTEGHLEYTAEKVCSFLTSDNPLPLD